MLAADRLVVDAYGGRVGHRSKIWRSANGCCYGFSGPTSYAELFRRWLDDNSPPKEIPEFESHHAIEVRPGNRVALSSGKKPIFIEIGAAFFAIGSGWQLALGAMQMGATAEQAVEVAIMHDENCGGQIDVIRVYEQSAQYSPQVAPVSFPDRIDPIHLGGPR